MKHLVILICILSLYIGCSAGSGEAQVRDRGKMVAPQAADVPDQARTWALCIGISAYEPEDLSLKWANKDAIQFCDFLQYDLDIPDRNYKLLQDRNATRDEIETHLAWLNGKAREGDRVYIFYAGHGKPASPFIPYDSEKRITLEYIQRALRKIDAHNIILIADACYSGKLAGRGARALESLDIRGLDRTIVVDLAQSKPGTVIMTSANGIQKAREFEGQKNGLFTHHLLQTLKNEHRYPQIDLDHDGRISLYEVYQQVYQDVSRHSEQQPQISDLDLARQIILFAYMQPTPMPTATPAPTAKPHAPTPQPTATSISLSCWENRRPGQECRAEKTGMEFVWIPGDTFEMGCLKGDTECGSDEKPPHTVTLDGFWMGKYEVTNTQYRRWQRNHDSQSYEGHSLNGDSQPAVYVSWEDATAFADWLGKFRLPTEAEWEYAARAGTTTSRFWNNNPADACRYANVHDLTSKRVNKFDWTQHECDDGYAVTAAIGSFSPNKFGLYDMLGNVWEWCADIYDSDAYKKHSSRNPLVSSGGSNRVLRGGSWRHVPGYVRSADRFALTPSFRSDNVGLRLVRKK